MQVFNGGIAQLARAPALQAGGLRFDSVYLHQTTQVKPFGLACFLCSRKYRVMDALRTKNTMAARTKEPSLL